MTGGLMQLVGRGAQDHLTTGNPSFTHFRSVYKRHTEFAMEHFRLAFRTNQLSIPTTGTRTFRAKVERYADLVNDCYLSVDIPDIYSPVAPITPWIHSQLSPDATAIGYEFQWVKNLGYNMIHQVSVLINGGEVCRHTGEWMKLYSYLKFDETKRKKLDEMVGNVAELNDPANAFDRLNQYPHAISTATSPAEPSIRGRTLLIPLHFWFCETVGASLPLVALQKSEVEIVVELNNLYDLFTIRDVRDSSTTTFGSRIAADPSVPQFTVNHFLSPPLYNAPLTPTNPDLLSWSLNPFIEANYIFLGDSERVHIARSDQSFKITQVEMKEAGKQYGPSNDLELVMHNLCTQVVWVAQRDDRALQNDWDNYTNWVDPSKPPLDSTALLGMTPWYSSGVQQPSNVAPRNILVESGIIIDGKERFSTKQQNFFSQLQQYRHYTGQGNPVLPGVYTYSFALDHYSGQPSGTINGSMFNKTILRNTFVQPPYMSFVTTPTPICVLKSTAGSANPTVVNPANYSPDEVLTIVQKEANPNSTLLEYTFNVRAYVESYNFLRILGGIANVVFSS